MILCLSSNTALVLFYFLQIGNGDALPGSNKELKLPAQILMSHDATEQELIQWTYPSFEVSDERSHLLTTRCILAPLRTTVDDLNEACLELFPAEPVEY